MFIPKSQMSRSGVALVDLLACCALLVIVATMGVPTLERARELSKRMTCSINLKGIGLAGAAYAEANKGEWMTPPFKRNLPQYENIAYLCESTNNVDSPCVGFERHRQSHSDTIAEPAAGSTAMSTTRAFWMLVRSGDVSVKQFTCPSSLHDEPDPTELIDLYYDFQEYKNISYGYLVPFGPLETRPRHGSDPRVVLAADKGPFYRDIRFDFQSYGPDGTSLHVDHKPKYWRPSNSANHGSNWDGDGQNMLHADGRVVFHSKPIGGVDHDNIYTVMKDEWGLYPDGRIHGYRPHDSSVNNPFPGVEAFGDCISCYSTTDSLIYP